MHKQAHCCDEAANHRLPIAVAFWIIQMVSMEECSSLTQNLMQIHCSTHSVILNVMATQYTCSLTLRCLLPPLISAVKSSLFTHAHPVQSPWLPGYIDVTWTILVTLTMAGLFPDRFHTRIYFSLCLSLSLSLSLCLLETGDLQSASWRSIRAGGVIPILLQRPENQRADGRSPSPKAGWRPKKSKFFCSSLKKGKGQCLAQQSGSRSWL